MLEQNETHQQPEQGQIAGHLDVMSRELHENELSPGIQSLAEATARAAATRAYSAQPEAVSTPETYPALGGVERAAQLSEHVVALREEYNQSHFQLAA